MARERSPNYPGIDLGEALQLVERLFTREGRTPSPVPVVAQAFGYKSASGPAKSKIGALKQYGLVTQSKGQITVSDFAVRILLAVEDTPESRAAIQQAALSPPLFKELYESMADASPSNLKQHLVLKRRFTQEGAERVIESYMGTRVIAKLDGTSYDDESEEIVDVEEPKLDTRGMQNLQLPISSGKALVLTGNFPITSEEWEQMLTVLNAMKPALTERTPPPDTNGD